MAFIDSISKVARVRIYHKESFDFLSKYSPLSDTYEQTMFFNKETHDICFFSLGFFLQENRNELPTEELKDLLDLLTFQDIEYVFVTRLYTEEELPAERIQTFAVITRDKDDYIDYGLTYVNNVLVSIATQWNEDLQFINSSNRLGLKIGDSLETLKEMSIELGYNYRQ